MSNDKIYVAKLHWIIFLGPLLWVCVAMTIGIYLPQIKEIVLLFVLVGLIWVAMTWVNYHYSSVTIQPGQLIIRTGILVRNTTDVALAKIESIDIRQSLIGSILGYGLLVIIGTGGTRYMINFLSNPLTCRRYIEQLRNENQSA